MKKIIITLALVLGSTTTAFAAYGIYQYVTLKQTSVTLFDNQYLSDRGVKAYSFQDGPTNCYIVEKSDNLSLSCVK